MPNYRIITDACCDLPQELIRQLDIIVQPLQLLLDNRACTAATEEELKAVYDAMRQGKSTSTSAVNPAQWRSALEPVLAAGEDALVLAFSSGLSTTYQSAVIAAEELAEEYPHRQVRVVDTLCASLGQGLLVWHACAKRDAGMDLEALTAWCQEWRYKLCHWFTVDDLMFLKRGGRIGSATAVVGTMLKIKPVLHVDNEGHLTKKGMARGRRASIDALAEKMKATALPGVNSTVFICHGDCLEDARYLSQRVKETCGAQTVMIGYTGAVIGAHSGPGTLALFFLGKER